MSATPADLALESLRASGPDAYRCDPKRPGAWNAFCPCCLARLEGRRTLRVVEHGDGGPVSLRCANRCTEDEIASVLFAPAPPAAEHPLVGEVLALADAAVLEIHRLRVMAQAADREELRAVA